jgi:hypothetical protein
MIIAISFSPRTFQFVQEFSPSFQGPVSRQMKLPGCPSRLKPIRKTMIKVLLTGNNLPQHDKHSDLTKNLLLRDCDKLPEQQDQL